MTANKTVLFSRENCPNHRNSNNNIHAPLYSILWVRKLSIFHPEQREELCAEFFFVTQNNERLIVN